MKICDHHIIEQSILIRNQLQLSVFSNRTCLLQAGTDDVIFR